MANISRALRLNSLFRRPATGPRYLTAGLPRHSIAIPASQVSPGDTAMSDVLSDTKRDLPLRQDDAPKQFWKVGGIDRTFWDTYLFARPTYSTDFYNTIFSHHAAHSSSWVTAHDVACGPGQVILELASRFENIVASDINETHLVVCKEQMHRLNVPASQVTYTRSPGEQLYQHHAAASADLVVIGEAMPLMDGEAVLDSCSRLLKPGGTLAVWFYGRATFADTALRASAQPIFDEIFGRNWRKDIERSETKQLPLFTRSAVTMASWLDNISFDLSTWTHVHRIKWNTDATLSLFAEQADVFGADVQSRVRTDEQREERADSTWWQKEWNLAEVRRSFECWFPAAREHMMDGDPVIKALLESLAREMGGEQMKHKLFFPAVLVMATRK